MKPKKSLGQNFLTSGKAVLEIIKAGDIKENDNILEIGPGKGALTEKLLVSPAKKIICIEKDNSLIDFLNEKYNNTKVQILNEDILNVDIEKIFNKNESYKIIANIPYYITGAIIEKFLSIDHKPELMILLVQKEVAERLTVKNKKESILSLATALYGNSKIVYKVSAGSFYPKPKVDSAVIKIVLNKEKISKDLEDIYLEIVKKSLSSKRKMMLSNLKKTYKNQDWGEIFKKLKINEKVRAEDLGKDIFLKLAKEVLSEK